jgi:hypothetical protein
MKLSKIKEEFYYFSGKTSELARQFALIGYGLIWVLKPAVQSVANLHPLLLHSIVLLTITLCIDILHYLYGSMTWGAILFYQEKKATSKDPDIEISHAINFLTWCFFVLKVLTLVVAYYYILRYVLSLN